MNLDRKDMIDFKNAYVYAVLRGVDKFIFQDQTIETAFAEFIIRKNELEKQS